MADVALAKALFDARVEEVYKRRNAILRRNPGKRAEVQAWVDCAEEMACVAYDVVRFTSQSENPPRPEYAEPLKAEAERMAARHAELSAQLSGLEAALE